MRFVLVALVMLPQIIAAQDADGLRARIEEHYTAIHAQDSDATRSHHLNEISIFPGNGHVLMEPGWEEGAARMGMEPAFPDAQVAMRHFSAQLYDDVGVAMFYLDSPNGTFRVTAVWVWRDGRWMESHHHESRLIG